MHRPEEWAANDAQREKAHVPGDVIFNSKPEIALDQMWAAPEAGVAPGVALADAGYGADGAFRAGVTVMGLRNGVGVQSTLGVWPSGSS